MFSSRIKKIRTELDLSVAKMSEKIDIPARTITSYESGRVPSLEFLTQLCTILNVNANWFITGKGNMFKQPELGDIENGLELQVVEIMRKYGVVGNE